MKFFKIILLIFISSILSLFLITCSDHFVSDNKNLNSPTGRASKSKFKKAPKYSQDPVVQETEEPFIELSKKIPAFGGYYLTKQGELVTLVKNVGNKLSVKQQVLSYITNRYKGRGLQLSLSEITIKNANYSYEELSKWRDMIIGTALNLEGVTMVDLSEEQNKLVIGVVNESIINEVESLVLTANIPLNAIKIEETGKINPLVSIRLKSKVRSYNSNVTLQDEIRPLIGGIQIASDGYGFFYIICTYGFNVIWDGIDAFITNSHCTEGYWDLVNTTEYYQNNYKNYQDLFIGRELYDPNGFTCIWGGTCRYSDASIIQLDTDVDKELGIIAKTGRAANWTSGTIVLTGTLKFIGDSKDIIEGMFLSKVGRSSGGTIGFVDGTCVTFNREDNKHILCQTLVNQMYAEGGDSGSPVFFDVGGEDVDRGEAKLMGILWGGLLNQEKVIISPMSNIRADLEGNQHNLVTYGSQLLVNITGSGFVDQAGTYTWQANPRREDGTVSYQWSIKWEGSFSWQNLGSNSYQSVSIYNENDFTLKVEISDISESTSSQKFVIVDLSGGSTMDPGKN